LAEKGRGEAGQMRALLGNTLERHQLVNDEDSLALPTKKRKIGVTPQAWG